MNDLTTIKSLINNSTTDDEKKMQNNKQIVNILLKNTNRKFFIEVFSKDKTIIKSWVRITSENSSLSRNIWSNFFLNIEDNFFSSMFSLPVFRWLFFNSINTIVNTNGAYKKFYFYFNIIRMHEGTFLTSLSYFMYDENTNTFWSMLSSTDFILNVFDAKVKKMSDYSKNLSTFYDNFEHLSKDVQKMILYDIVVKNDFNYYSNVESFFVNMRLLCKNFIPFSYISEKLRKYEIRIYGGFSSAILEEENYQEFCPWVDVNKCKNLSIFIDSLI